MNTTHVTFPETTTTVPLINKSVARPLVAKVIVALSESVPAIYAVVIVQVIVILPEVLLKRLITSPAAKVEFGIVIDPLVPIPTNSPTSPTANV